MTFYAFLIIYVHKILNFGHFSQKHDQKYYGLTDRRMDIPSYRVAWMRLKKDEMVVQFHYMKKVGKDIIFTFVFYVVHHNDKKDCIQGV